MRVIVFDKLNIHKLIQQGYYSLVRTLIRIDPSRSAEEFRGWLPLHTLCRYHPDQIYLMKDLIEVNSVACAQQTPKGSLPLHLVSSFGGWCEDALKLLLKIFPKGASIRSIPLSGK